MYVASEITNISPEYTFKKSRKIQTSKNRAKQKNKQPD